MDARRAPSPAEAGQDDEHDDELEQPRSFVARSYAALLLGEHPEKDTTSKHEKTLSRPVAESTLGKWVNHPEGAYVLVEAESYPVALRRLADGLKKDSFPGLVLPLHLIPDRPLRERRLELSPEHLRKFAAYLVLMRGGEPTRVLGPQKRGRGADPATSRVRAVVAWELNKLCGVPRSELTELFGVHDKVRITQLVNDGRELVGLPQLDPSSARPCRPAAVAGRGRRRQGR